MEFKLKPHPLADRISSGTFLLPSAPSPSLPPSQFFLSFLPFIPSSHSFSISHPLQVTPHHHFTTLQTPHLTRRVVTVVNLAKKAEIMQADLNEPGVVVRCHVWCGGRCAVVCFVAVFVLFGDILTYSLCTSLLFSLVLSPSSFPS